MQFIDQTTMRRPGAVVTEVDGPKLTKNEGRRVRKRPPPVAHSLRSAEEISILLRLECQRCERSGSEFCLVVFNPGPTRWAADKLGQLLIDNARATDEVGHYDDRRLCAVLPYTGRAGAEFYVGRIINWARAEGINATSQLFVHTADGFEEEPPVPAEHAPSPESNIRSVASVDTLLARPIPTWKRSLDILVSIAALIAAAPVMILTAIAIKLSSRGPVMFCQQRAGLGGRPFTIFKFRTMVTDAEKLKASLRSQSEQDGPAFKMTADPRVTRIGKVLRVTSLDELPQLWNVLKGDMSLVGPRPLPVDEARAVDTWHRRRLDVTPGLTCIWQVEGRGTVTFAEWVRMDRRYIRRHSFKQDVVLLFRTLPAVLLRRGAK